MATATVIEGGGGSGSDTKNGGDGDSIGRRLEVLEVDLQGSGDTPSQPQYQFHALCVRLDLEKIDILEKGVSKIGKKLNFEGLNSRQILGVTPSIEKNLGRVRRPQIHRRKFWKLGCFRN